MTALACRVCLPRTVPARDSERGCACIAQCDATGCTGDVVLTAVRPVSAEEGRVIAARLQGKTLRERLAERGGLL